MFAARNLASVDQLPNFTHGRTKTIQSIQNAILNMVAVDQSRNHHVVLVVTQLAIETLAIMSPGPTPEHVKR